MQSPYDDEVAGSGTPDDAEVSESRDDGEEGNGSPSGSGTESENHTDDVAEICDAPGRHISIHAAEGIENECPLVAAGMGEVHGRDFASEVVGGIQAMVTYGAEVGCDSCSDYGSNHVRLCHLWEPVEEAFASCRGRMPCQDLAPYPSAHVPSSADTLDDDGGVLLHLRELSPP